MIVTIFSKKRATKEGKKFTAYIGRLTKKDGSQITASVHFDEGISVPAECPCCIEIAKNDANLSSKEYVREDTGEMGTRYDLWVKAWTPGPEYVDHSLDDFE